MMAIPNPRLPTSPARLAQRLAAGIGTCLLLLTTATLAAATDRSVEDADVTRAIESDFWSDPAVDPHSIDVEAREGIVTLSGTVPSLLDRERAERIAESIVGVRAIINRIEVDALKRDDAPLANAVQEALRRDPATDAYEVRAEASKGVVTLSGAVDSWTEWELSETVAKQVRGVREVRNQIRIREPDPKRSDLEIQADIEARLANDVRVDDYGIGVKVHDGRVSMEGVVGSLAEKVRARSDARVAGVDEVVDDDLEIVWWARDKMRRKGYYQQRSDEEIAEAVRDAFLYDPRVLSANPRVHVSNGVVTLTGVVHDLAARRAAESDARNVLGVWRVRNLLKVRPEAIPADEVLEQRVARALREDDHVNRWDTQVLAHDGAVYLSGRVASSFEKERAELLAERVKGTVRVVNNLDYAYEWVWKSDWEIREDVEDQLFWSPFVDSDAITVDVEAGVVTLKGEVATWAERDDAAKNAWEGGAKDVRNELSVDHEVYGPLASYPQPYYHPYSPLLP